MKVTILGSEGQIGAYLSEYLKKDMKKQVWMWFMVLKMTYV